MALTRLPNTPSAGRVAYRFEYQGTTAIIDKKADHAAHYLFDLGYGNHGGLALPDGSFTPVRVYADLSLAEKLVLLDTHVLGVILNLSLSYIANADAETARLAAIAQEKSEVII